MKLATPTGKSGKIHLASLDGLRGVAALAVFGDHFEYFSKLPLGLGHAGSAVDFFFILSGFVIGRTYEARMGAGLSWRPYMALRIKRLYPVMLAAVVLGAAVAVGRGEPLYPAMALQVLLLPVFWGPPIFGGELFPLNGPQWSLFFELFANALHAAAFSWLTDRRLAVVVGLAALLLTATAFYFGGLNGGWTRYNFWGGPPRAIFGFSAGLMIFRLQARGVVAPRVPYALVVAGLILCLTRPFVPYGDFPALDLSIALVALPALVFLAVRSPVQGRVATWATWAGALSYPLYAIHMPLLRAWEGMFGGLPDDYTRLGWIVALPVLLGMAFLFERNFDTPIRRWMQARRRRVMSPA
jgi:peptidoglycan/LPS O-acetylase OafA/YrhL